MFEYNRERAVEYAHRWAFDRNPAYYDYSEIGGDCTNFVSQSLYAGSGVMDFTRTFGWYYINANNKAPAWTGVQELFNYLTSGRVRPGPVAIQTGREEMLPGDIVQISFDGETFRHTPIIVAIEPEILVAAHSVDSDNRPLSTYEWKKLRFLHIVGVYEQNVRETKKKAAKER